ncbi:FAD/NAD(P)-binding domain-containing protein [Auricularia subglabra TFB-10046 SS5]|nr:FAD/NAD(P)-binding domain-containing protein [Auricularia subglabra TFB-10046 SS5]
MVQNVVIVGGGPAGLHTAIALAKLLDPKEHELVLVSERPFYAHLISGLRANVTDDGGLEEKAFMPLDKFFRPGRPGRFVNARVERADGESVHLSNGETLPYAALVLATGSTWRGMLRFPDTLEKTKELLHAWRAKFAAAKSVLIIGGGAVGVELAGEIHEFYPKTEVTLVHGQKFLLNDAYTDAFRKKLGVQFAKAGTKLILDDTVLDVTADPTAELTGPVKTAKGVELNADLIIQAVGPKPDSSIAATLDASVITPDGRVKVLPTLQLPLESGKRNVFAAGDIIDWPEQHTSLRAAQHAPIVAQNVVAVLKGKEPTAKHSKTPEMIFITRGKSGGLGYAPVLWGLTIGGFMVKMIKGKDLLVGMFAKTFGY